MVGFMIVLPLLPFYALDLHASPEIVGLLIASFSIAQLVSAPFWGRVSDRYGRRPALLIGLSASAIAYVVFGFAESLWLLFLSRLVQGAGGGTTGVAQAYVADTMPAKDRAKALGWLSAATSAGVAFGPVIGSFAAHLGRAAPGLVAAALCLVNVAFAWRWLPESRLRETGPAPTPAAGLASGLDRPPPPRRAALPAALDLRHRHGGVRVADLGARAVSRGGVRARRARPSGRSSPTSGSCRSSCGASCWVRSWTAWVSCGRCGSERPLLALGLWLYPTPESLWAFAAVIPLVPIGTALLFPSTTSLMSRQSDPRELGTTMGVAQTFAGLARVAAPLLATMAFQRLGHGAPFYLGGACVALAGVLAFRIQVGPSVSAHPAAEEKARVS